MKKKKNKKSITVCIPVRELDGIWNGDFKNLPPNKTFELVIDYPLDKPALFPIKTGKKGIGMLRLFKEIGKAYNKVYDDVYQYGVFGHDIGDLFLEGINIDYEKHKITIEVGS